MSGRRNRRYKMGRSGFGGAIKPQSLVSKAVAVISVVSIAVFGIMIAMAVRYNGETDNWFGGAAVLLLLLAFCCLAFAIREFRNLEYDIIFRAAGLGLGIVSSVLWGSIYILGLLIG